MELVNTMQHILQWLKNHQCWCQINKLIIKLIEYTSSVSAALAAGDVDTAAATQSSWHDRPTPGAPLQNPPMTCNHGNRQQTSCKLCACKSARERDRERERETESRPKIHMQVFSQCSRPSSGGRVGGHFLSGRKPASRRSNNQRPRHCECVSVCMWRVVAPSPPSTISSPQQVTRSSTLLLQVELNVQQTPWEI